MMSNNNNNTYKHASHAGNHADVFKHVTFCAAIRSLQEIHAEGIVLVDACCGNGLYDVSSSQGTKGEATQGIKKVIDFCETTKKAYEIPKSVKDFIQVQNDATNMGMKTAGMKDEPQQQVGSPCYAGTPLLGQKLLRLKVDEHRLCDKNVMEVIGLNQQSPSSTVFVPKLDCFDPKSFDFVVPDTTRRHLVIFIDPPYKDDSDYVHTRELFEKILERNPKATVIIWIPLIHGTRQRFHYAKTLKEIAKEKAAVGRYYASMCVAREGFQGSGMLVCNPTPDFDAIIDEKTLAFLATVMNQGKDEYSVEQVMKMSKK